MNSRGIAGLAGLVAAGALATAGPAFGTVTTTFSNPTPIIINDATVSGTQTAATPYPSGVLAGAVPAASLSGRSGPTVSVTLNGLTHTSPADLDISLVNPAGAGRLYYHAGGTTPVSNATLTFVANGPQIPVAGPVVSGVFGPFSNQVPLKYAPGAWQLYVSDTEPDDDGVISGGFSVNVTYTPSNVFTIGGATVNKKKGTASLKVTVPNPGVIALNATNTVKGATVSAPSAGTYVVPVNASGKSLKKLKKKHKAVVTASVQYTPTGGAASRATAYNVTLKTKKAKKKHKHHQKH